MGFEGPNVPNGCTERLKIILKQITVPSSSNEALNNINVLGKVAQKATYTKLNNVIV